MQPKESDPLLSPSPFSSKMHQNSIDYNLMKWPPRTTSFRSYFHCLPEVPGGDVDGRRKSCPGLIRNSLPLSQAHWHLHWELSRVRGRYGPKGRKDREWGRLVPEAWELFPFLPFSTFSYFPSLGKNKQTNKNWCLKRKLHKQNAYVLYIICIDIYHIRVLSFPSPITVF